jgi:F-type H+-transporting ATPase subunit epsilon
MANTYKFELVTPERMLLSEEVLEVNAPGSEGYLGILAFHMPLLTALVPGEVRARLADGSNAGAIVISGGFLQVAQAKTTILADAAELAEEIDADAAQADLVQARKALADSEAGSPEHGTALRNIAYAEARLRSRA